MQRAGIDTSIVFARIGFNPEYLKQRDLRIPHNAQAVFWSALEDVTGDPDIGLHLAPHIPTYTGDVLEYLFFSSPTFREGGRRAMKYSRLFSDALNSELSEEAGKASMTLVTGSGDLPALRHSEVCITYGLIKFLQSVSDGAFKAERVDLRMAKPHKSDEYAKVFGCPVRFSADRTVVHFDPAILDRPSRHSEPELLDLHEELAKKQLVRLISQDVVEEVKRVLSRSLEYDRCDLETVAKQLARSPRRLRLELSHAGTSFNQVLADFRFALAKRLLAMTNEPVERIAYLTGFSEVSTFYRAFRRWAGKTPVQYRNDKKPRIPARHWAKGDVAQG